MDVTQPKVQNLLRAYVEKLKSGKLTPHPLPKRNPIVEARKLKIFASALATAGLTAEQCRKIIGDKVLTKEEIQKIAKNFDSAQIVPFKKRFHIALQHNPNIENFFQSIVSIKMLNELARLKHN